MPDDPTSPKEPTLFAEASLVSHFPKRESSKPKTTPDISGRKCLELSGNSGPLGCVEKMLLGSLDWAWTKYSLTWKAKATPQGRLIFQLARQAHPTSDNDYGLLHTPTAKANQMAPSMVERGHGNWVLNLWPTPRVSMAKGPTKKEIQEGNPKRRLETEVHLWPTPTVQDLNKTTGRLNPKWVAWLMGYPIEYLSCVPWGTQSSRKSRKE